jgi:hypothetical protein
MCPEWVGPLRREVDMRSTRSRVIGLLVIGVIWIVTAVAVSITSVAAQRLNPSARELLNSPRQLLAAEIPVILDAVRAAAAGKTLRLAYAPGGPGPELLMASNGRPRFVRTTSGYDFGGTSSRFSRGDDGSMTRSQSQQTGHVDLMTFTDYTGRPARKCDGTALDEEFVIEYERRSPDNQWTAKARTRTPMEPLSPPFEMLDGTISLETGERRQIGDRMARALIAPWRLPAGVQSGGALPPGMTQSLWIDNVSMLPLRWSISIPAMPDGTPAIPDYGLSFTYDPSIDVRPPDGVTAPDCIR